MMRDPSQVADALGVPFSDEQMAAIAAPLEPGVIIAGAGSGKTTVMAARVVWLVGSGQVRRDQVLGLTFTRKAAAELAGRVAAALATAGLGGPGGADEGGELILTYDAFAGRVVDDYGLYLGLEPGLRMVSGAARFQLAYRVVSKAAGPFPALARLRPETVARRVLALASELRSHLAAPEAVEKQAARFLAALQAAPRNRSGNPYRLVAQAEQAVRERLELLGLVGGYEQLKAELGFVEFADQMAWAARLAAEVPRLPADAREAYRVVLLDEYQDTSSAQAVLLRRLFSGPDAANGRGHPVTAVGDPCQAIYGWRGAAVSNIALFARQFPRADGRAAESFPLTVNRRSGQRVLDAANALATGLNGPEGGLVAPAGTPPGEIEVATFDTWPDELAWLGGRVASLRETGGVSQWSDIAVLTRRNNQVADVYAELTARGVPAEVVGIGGLLDVPVVAEVVATLRALADPADNPAVIRLLTSSRWAIGLGDLAALGARARSLSADDPSGPAASLLEAAADPGDAPLSGDARQRLAAFSRQLASLRRWANGSLADLVAQVVAVLGLDIEARVQGGASGCLEAFADVVDTYAGLVADGTLVDFLAYLQAERDDGIGLERPVVSDENSVKLLTVHKAKGLEWEAVFLPGLADGVFPATRASTFLSNASSIPAELRGDADGVPQVLQVSQAGLTRYTEDVKADLRRAEDRLAYVAVTRARQLVCASAHRWEAGMTRPRTPSPYLDALREHATRVSDPEKLSDVNPLAGATLAVRWPDLGDEDARRRRQQAAAWVRAGGTDPQALAELGADDRETYERWRERARALVAEAVEQERARREVVAPDYLSVTALASALADPGAFAASLAHPAPRLADRSAAAGTRAHRWLESRLTQPLTLSEDDEEEGPVVDDQVADAFASSPYADAAPVAVEFPFTLTLADRVVRGRIDAVFANRDGYAYQVVDWKTGDARRANPLQLACYRLAWAELHGLDPAQVDAVFYDLARRRVVRPEHLPGREELMTMVGGTTRGGDTLSA